jgi:hypothetical protein
MSHWKIKNLSKIKGLRSISITSINKYIFKYLKPFNLNHLEKHPHRAPIIELLLSVTNNAS